ncbi:hypothetical protein [Aquimarina sp. I32.4]|uniref:hypothetical protein n=1 Tax=Aquimarina sp. I32.4 TaxID=2053903 RepID=UPI000CDEBB70|nr:hypothetical protein [Aquimarina sp. I32.4]
MEKNNLHTNNGFKVPENYFESFTNKLSEKVSSTNNQNTPTLPDKKDTGFKVPKEYFTTLEGSIQQKLSANKSKGKIISLVHRKNILYISGIAAMITLILTISIQKKSEFDFDDIKVTDVHTYFSEENIELTNTEIASLLGEDINYTEVFEDELITDDTLLEYLSEENLDDEIIFVE